MIRFNLQPGEYEVERGLRDIENYLAFFFITFFIPWVIMLAYGAVALKFIPEAPHLGYLEILVAWAAIELIISAILHRPDHYTIKVSRREEN